MAWRSGGQHRQVVVLSVLWTAGMLLWTLIPRAVDGELTLRRATLGVIGSAIGGLVFGVVTGSLQDRRNERRR